jgi:hypothetical protein
MKATRVDNWPFVLSQKVEEWRPRLFDWTTWNCCHLADDHVAAITGVSRLSMFPSFSTQADAEAILSSFGGMIGLVTHALKQEPIPVAWAKRGDLLVANFGYGLSPAPCLGVNSCAPGPRGLVFRPTASAVAAWAV